MTSLLAKRRESAEGRPLCSQYFIALVLVSVFVGVLVSALTHFSTPMPGYWEDAKEFAAIFRIPDPFRPDFYPALLGLSLHFLGYAGPVFVQLVMYEIFVVSMYLIFRLLNLSAFASAVFAQLLGLCPDLVTGIQKIWDIEACSAAFAALVCGILMIAVRGGTTVRLVFLGIVWGVGIAIRPNFPLLIVPIAFAIWVSLPAGAKRYGLLVRQLLLVSVIGFGVMAGLNRSANGLAWWPQNGPYNFFAGANLFTEDSLRTHLNAEPSIIPAVQQMGINVPDSMLEHPNPVLQKLYTRQGMAFVFSHPLKWAIQYGAVKFFTMLRPDTKVHPLLSAEGLPRLVVSCGLIAWLLAISFRPRTCWKRFDAIVVLLIIFYSLPFLLTNADPRFGLTLNLFLWSAAIATVYASARQEVSSPVKIASPIAVN